MIEVGQVVATGSRPQPQIDAMAIELAGEVTQGFVELLLARDPLGQVELAADLARRLDLGDVVAAAGRDACTSQPGRAGPDTRPAPRVAGRRIVKLGLGAGPRVAQANGAIVLPR